MGKGGVNRAQHPKGRWRQLTPAPFTRPTPTLDGGCPALKALTQQLKQKSRELGFVLCGVAPAAAPGRWQQFSRWLDAGYAGQMHYLAGRRDAYRHPRFVLDGCRTIMMLALPYATETESAERSAAEGVGRVARYAWGEIDYHDVIHDRLASLCRWVESRHPAASVRGVVDTAPLLEREFAEMAGLGWIGKNTLLLNRTWGSYFFLAALLTDLALDTDPPQEKGYCGTCTACLDACPTDAFPQPFVLDATRCISYLTIEHRDHIDDALKPHLGNWVFGCDICQEVCPWNRKARHSDEPQFAPRADLRLPDLLGTLSLTEQQFRQRFRQTPLWRSKRRGILRNAILVVGNQRFAGADEALDNLLLDDEPLIRAAAAWAIGRIASNGWRERLSRALAAEADPAVRAAIENAITGAPPTLPDAEPR